MIDARARYRATARLFSNTVLVHKSFVTTLYSKSCGVAEEEQFSVDKLCGDLLSVAMTTRNNTEQSYGRAQFIERPLN